MRAGRRGDQDVLEVFGGLPERPVVTQHDVVTLAPLDAFREPHAAERRLDHRLERADVDVASGELRSIGRDLQVLPAEHSVGEGRARPRDGGDDGFDLARNAFDGLEIIARDLDPNGGAYPRRDHVHANLDRIAPGVDEAWHLQARIQILDDPVRRHPGPPGCFRLEANPGFDHGEGCRVGGGVGATGFPEDAVDLGHRGDDPVGLAKDLPHLGRRHTGQGRRHVEELPLVQGGHEFRSQLAQRHDHARRESQGEQHGEPPQLERHVEQGPVEPHQNPIEGVPLRRDHPAPEQPVHQYRHERDRQDGRERHRIRLGVGERREQAVALAGERKYRQE